MKEVQLTIASTYVSDWGIWEAFRELAQNAMDHADVTATPISIGFSKRSKNLILTSQNTKLDINSLVLGATAKSSDSDQRGQFGEGYKLALVVLLRLGIKVQIVNADEVWTPSFKYSEVFQTELLTIRITPIKTHNRNVTFVLKGVSKEQANLLTSRIIRKRSATVGYRTEYGRILTEERFKGLVFVGGIYVCKPNLEGLEHGYDFDPQHVTLGRDRGLMDSFNVQWLASKMWATIFTPDTKVIEETAKLIQSDSPSTKHFGVSGSNKLVSAKVSEDFYEEFSSNAVPVTTEGERNRVLNDFDNAVPIIVSETLKRTVKNTDLAKKNSLQLKARLHLTPNEVITAILGKYRKELGMNFNILTQELIPVSLHWVTNKSSVVLKDDNPNGAPSNV